MLSSPYLVDCYLGWGLHVEPVTYYRWHYQRLLFLLFLGLGERMALVLLGLDRLLFFLVLLLRAFLSHLHILWHLYNLRSYIRTHRPLSTKVAWRHDH